MKKQIILFAAVGLILLMLPIICKANTIASGNCGDDITWNINDEGSMLIDGSGEMGNYSGPGKTAPWYSYRTSIKSVIISNGVTNIGTNSFSECEKLTSIIIPDSVTKIGAYAFSKCYSLTSFTISPNINSVGWGAFSYCNNMVSILVDSSSPYFASVDGVLFNKTLTTLITCPAGKDGSYVIPVSVTTIAQNAFEGCSGLLNIVISDSVTAIGDVAFQGCTGLRSMLLPKSITVIGFQAFSNCNQLKSFTIPACSSYLTEYFKNSTYQITMIPHTLTEHAKVDANCTESGTEGYWSCDICGKLYFDSYGRHQIDTPKSIAALGHTEAVDAGKPATCTEAGLSDGKHCSVCNTVLVAQEVIPAFGHLWDEGVITKEATYSETGIKTYTCQRCGATQEEVINMVIPLGQSGWVEKDGKWFYGNSEGNAVMGSATIDGTMYCFNEKGEMISGWAEVGGKWYYAKSSGAIYHNGWVQVGKTWYYFRSNGEMAVGWVNDGGTYYYMKSDGTMATGWVEDEGKWYYMDKDGAMKTGWMKDGKTWYLLKSSGEMAVGWAKDGGTWYYFTSSGAMKTGWYEEKESDGTSSWYWFDKDGAMATGWKEIDRKWEFFDNSGVWQYTWDGR